MKRLKKLLATLYQKPYNLLLSNGWAKSEIIYMVVGLLMSFLALLGFIAIADEVMDHDIKKFDAQITRSVATLRTDSATRFMLVMTEFGGRPVYVFFTLIIAGILLLLNERWITILEIVLVLIMTGILNRLLKFSFERPRPTEFMIVLEESWSFPSGHAMTAIAFYGFIILLIWRRRTYLVWRFIVSAILATIILLVGLSRVYLGVHYPSDVLAGYAAGLFWLMLSGSVFQWVSNWQKRKNQLNAG